MKLQAIFWDYPQFLDKNYLSEQLRKHQQEPLYLWFMRRFLEYGRVVDTFRFFTIQEISENFDQLKLTPYTQKKWTRLIDVYASPERG